jgi:hypothetical protein
MPSSEDHTTIQNCSTVQTHCAADLLVRTPEQLIVPVLHSEPLAEAAHVSAANDLPAAGNNQRSPSGSAPPLIPLRI